VEKMTEPYFPEEAVAMLRSAKFDPMAKPGLELISDALLWGDEMQTFIEFVGICRAKGRNGLEPLVFRSSLIMGVPTEKYRGVWEELQQRCPEWIGFRPERQSEYWQEELVRQRAEEE
jgi:hypothetical protein